MNNLENLINTNLSAKKELLEDTNPENKIRIKNEIDSRENAFTNLFSGVTMYKYNSINGEYFELNGSISYDENWKNFIIEIINVIYKRHQKAENTEIKTITKAILVAHESSVGKIEFDEFDLVESVNALRSSLNGSLDPLDSVNLKGFRVKKTTTVIELHYAEDENSSLFFFLQDESLTHLKKSMRLIGEDRLSVDHNVTTLALNPSSLILCLDNSISSNSLYCHNTFMAMKILSLREAIRCNTFRVLKDKINLNSNVAISHMNNNICRDVLSSDMFDYMDDSKYIEICKELGISTTINPDGTEKYYIGHVDLERFIAAVLTVYIDSELLPEKVTAKYGYKSAKIA